MVNNTYSAGAVFDDVAATGDIADAVDSLFEGSLRRTDLILETIFLNPFCSPMVSGFSGAGVLMMPDNQVVCIGEDIRCMRFQTLLS